MFGNKNDHATSQPQTYGQQDRGTDSRPRAFTSDLSGQEFWLLKNAGYTPVGLVLGNSIYSMGVSGGLKSAFRGMAKGEVKELTQLMYEARHAAMTRMRDEAEALGAEGVVGVNLYVEHHGDVIEVTAVGTAVKRDENYDPNKQGDVTVTFDVSSSRGNTKAGTADMYL